MTTMVCESNMA